MTLSKGTVASRALWRSGVARLLARREWEGVLTLAYHRILPEPGPRYFGGVWSATPEQFAAHLDQLTATCRIVSSRRLADLRNVRGRHVAITFDDGYRDVHEHALPALRERSLPATLFLTTGVIDGTAVPWWDQIAWLHEGIEHPERRGIGSQRQVLERYRQLTAGPAAALLDELAAASDRAPLTHADVRDEWLTWPLVRELAAGGVAIEAHTVQHPLMSRLPADEQQEEIASSADRIAEQTGERPRAFAYPVGQQSSFDERSRVAARRAGIELAFSLYGGPTTTVAPWDPLDVPRVGIDRAHDEARLGALLAWPELFGRMHDDARRARASRAALEEGKPPNGRRPAGQRPLRVVTVVDRLADGGAERIAFQLARELDPARFERVLVVTTADDPAHAEPAPETARWARELTDAGVRIVGLPRRRRSEPRGWGPMLAELRRADVVHAHMFSSNAIGSVLGGLTRVPVIVGHEHGLHRDAAWHGAFERRVVARRPVTMLAPSQAVRERMVRDDGLAADRVLVLPNGVEAFAPTGARDVRRELGIDPDALVVGSVGGLRTIKRLDVLIDAVPLMRDAIDGPFAVVIAGGGPERERLQARIARHGVEREVTLLGPRDDVPDLLAALDVAVNCSDSEACPLSVLEYMAAGLPTVATEVGGTPELVTHGEHGLLVPRGQPAALATAITTLADDPALRRRLGAAAHARRAAEFGLDTMVERVEALYERRYHERTRR